MEVKFVHALYEESDSLELQGTREKIEKYLRIGYYVKESRNGYWVLIKPAQVFVEVVNENSQYLRFSVKDIVLRLYNKRRISEKIFGKFIDDALNGKVKFYLTEQNELIIQFA